MERRETPVRERPGRRREQHPGGTGRAAGVRRQAGCLRCRGGTRLSGLSLRPVGAEKSSFSPGTVGCVPTKHRIASRRL